MAGWSLSGATIVPARRGELRDVFDRLGKFVARHWVAVIAGWLVLAAALHAAAPRWSDVANDGDLAYLPANLPSVEGERMLQRAFPNQKAKSAIAIVVERPDGALTADDLRWSDGLAALFRERTGWPIASAWNRNTEVLGERLTSRVTADGQATVTLLNVINEFMATDNVKLLAEVERTLANAKRDMPKGLNVGITGSAAIGGDMLASAAESIKNTELTTIALVIVILLVVYRAPLLVLVPLAAIGLTFFISADALASLTQLDRLPGMGWWNFKVFTTTKIFLIVVLFGAGTDFCLFLISRYREELERGHDRAGAAAEAVGRVGHALVASAMTTICGLATMFFADFGKFRNSGPAIAFSLAIGLAACLTLAPALLSAAGLAVFWPFGIRAARAGVAASNDEFDAARHSRFWEWISRVLLRRPGLILVASVLLTVPLAYSGLNVKVTYNFLNELARDRSSVYGTRLAERHFPLGETAPLTVLAWKRGGSFDTPEGNKHIGQLSKELYDFKGIERVLSLTEPLGNPPGYFQPLSPRGRAKLAALKHHTTKETYLAQAPELKGDVARFDLVLDADPFSVAAIATLDRVDAFLVKLSGQADSPWHDTQWGFVGTTAGIRDLALVTQSDQTLIERLVVIVVLAVLIVLLRRPVVCVYLIASVLFSYFVTMGVTRLFFSWLYAGTYRRIGLEGAVVLVRDPDRRGRGLQHLPAHPGGRGAAPPRAAGGAAPGRGPHRRDHYQLRRDHGRHVHLDDERHLAGHAGAGLCPVAGRDVRHLHRAAGPGSGLPGPARAISWPPQHRRARAASRRAARSSVVAGPRLIGGSPHRASCLPCLHSF